MRKIDQIDLKREQNRISKYKLCKEAQFHQPNYYKLLKDGNPTEKTLIKLEKALNKLILKDTGLNGR